ncbi:hypothetical protein C9374_012670 [Naegleria lovaniensis]|uniref:EF-hand domain-containing protein n=1 Tax=Naegleria lovaniensis TaxID=51637 RepID=A0AA88GWQ1_NAELO|nr:uncharacterized protein C9374_012670 [Naegleria lovaniensis]KAG2392418.1 hypothetical protein C9374_012670 [Naegleria lovaniensis]
MTSLIYCTDPKVIKSLFTKYDSKQVGSISMTDLDRLTSDLGFNFCQDEIFALSMYLDKNSDGVVTLDEFQQYWIKIASAHELSVLEKRMELLTQAAVMFKKYDTNGNRVLSSDEFEKFYKELYQNRNDASMKEVQQAMQSLDLDRNGVISFQEFIIWLNWLNLN